MRDPDAMPAEELLQEAADIRDKRERGEDLTDEERAILAAASPAERDLDASRH